MNRGEMMRHCIKNRRFIVVMFIIAGFFLYGCGEQTSVKIIGDEEIVFDWTTDSCEMEDIPDLPARAFRDSHGKVQLISTHFINRRMIGDDLASVKRDCRVIMSSHGDPDHAMHNRYEWISATYTMDGETIYALIHNENHGNTIPGQCASGDQMKCWYNSITLATSTDSGLTYTHAPAPSHLVASVPYPYVPDAGPYGIFAGTNIIYNDMDHYFYTLFHVEKVHLQEPGACVARTRNLSDPSSWRAWDGTAYRVQFIDPYAETDVNPAQHVCAPVDFDNILTMHESLTYNTYLKKYILVGSAAIWDQEQQELINGFYYSLSDDLINWSPRQLIMECELWWTADNRVDRVGYPSLIDPEDTTRNFSNTGRRPYLYFVRWNKNTNYDRDLIRVRIEFTKTQLNEMIY